MLSPALAATIELSEPADLAALPLLPHEDWPQWFREAGAEHLNLRFYADDYSTHELDAAAAIDGTGVALLSPILFAPLVAEGKLIQPFQHVMRGPNWHYALLDPRETTAAGARLLRLAGATGAWRDGSAAQRRQECVTAFPLDWTDRQRLG